MPVQIQPLNGQQVIVLANAQVAQLVDANACVTINASCIANNGGTGSGGNPALANTGGVTAVGDGCREEMSRELLKRPRCAFAKNGANCKKRLRVGI